LKAILLLVLSLLLSCGGGVYDLKLKDLEGREVKLSDYRRDGLVVYVWSGTCVGHLEDLKLLEDLSGKLKTPAVSVAIMMEPKDVRKVVEGSGVRYTYPILADPRGELARRITLLFLPATLVLDGKGNVVGNYPRLPKNLVDLVPSHK